MVDSDANDKARRAAEPTQPIIPDADGGSTGSTDLSGRELTMPATPAPLSGRELTMTPAPSTDLSGRELTMTPAPSTDLSGRELTMTPAPSTDLSGRELTMTPAPSTDLSGRELTITPAPSTDLSGRELTITPAPSTDLSGRELTMQGPPTPTPPTAGAGKPRTGYDAAGFKPRTGVGTSITFDDAWHLQGRKGQHTGATWGDFELGGILGEGGMGAVYRAKQKSLRRRVAIKVLPPNLAADQRLLQRFTLEATTTSKLQTPHVVQVYAIGEHDGNHYYAMEYVEGKDLYDIIKERREAGKPLTPDEAVGYILQAAKGLAEAGRHQIVHRDIKPPNMMVTKDGLLKIADFGIVKVLGEHQLTMTGQAVGTPAYVSPEQGRGDKEVDCRSDLYSLGVVFYELACDKKPFDGSTPNALIYQHCYEEPKLPKELNPAIPDDVQAVIMRCLQKKAENRYQSADELVRDLELIRTGAMLKSAIASYKLGTGADEAKREQMTWLQRNMLPVAAAALLIIGGGVAGGWWWMDTAAKQREAEALAKGQGEQAVIAKRGALAKALDAAIAIPDGTAARIDELAKLAKDGERDADVLRWRAKLAEVAALTAKLAPIETAAPTPALRASARGDLDALLAKVGGDDPAAARFAARLKAFDEQEARLRSECARLDTLALKLGDRERYGALLRELGGLIPGDDPQLTKWQRKLAAFDGELAALRARIAPLDAETQVTVAKRAQYLPVLTDLKVYLDEGDKDLRRWHDKLDQAGGRVAKLREDIAAVVGLQPDAIGKPKQDQIGTKLADYEALAGGEDAQLKDWRDAIAAGDRAIAKGREQLARFVADSGDGVLTEGVHEAFARELRALEALVYPGDAEVLKWTTQLADSRRVLADLRRDGAVLDPASAAPVTLAAQRDLAPKVERAAAKGAVDAARAQLWRDRLAAEAKRVTALRERLAAFDQPESITEAMREGLLRLTEDAGVEDADVRRWTAKRDRVDALVAKLAALDSRQGVPDEVGALFAELSRLVGEKDPRLVAWQGKVQRIEAARGALAVLDRRAPFDGRAIAAQLAVLAELVGTADRRYVAWQAKADEVGTLKTALAALPATVTQSPEANAQAHARLRRLAELVGPEDADLAAAARRQQELDGPSRPAWATAHGRDLYGVWAETGLGAMTLRLRFVPSGRFLIGSPPAEAGRDPDEDQVELTIGKAFWIADSECTQEQWAALIPASASLSRGASRPIERVAWAEAVAWCEALARAVPGLAARLPSEAEWEYAARGGGSGPWTAAGGAAVDADAVGWHAGSGRSGSREVKQRYPNPLGLFDTAGNVWEWCLDRYGAYPTTPTADRIGRDGELRVVRGGSWGDPPASTRAANRQGVREALRSAYIGFRAAADVAWDGPLDGRAILAAQGAAARRRLELPLGQGRLTIELDLPEEKR